MEYHLLITSDSELIESVSQVMKLKHNILRIKNLLEDQTYTFSIVALNSVGSVPTNGTKICESSQ